jgi:ABC-type multidrug transport system fused ATPase/permease subunit
MTEPPVQSGSHRRAATSAVAAHPVTSAVIAILVIASIFFSLYVPLYASATPKVGDFPFFYFYLIIYMPAVSIALWIVLMLQKRLRPGATAAGPDASAGEVTR